MTKTIEAIWQLLQQHQGETFHTAKGLPFTYTIRGGELFVNRRRKSITVSTVRRALEKITLLEAAGEVITGPKKIGCYGAGWDMCIATLGDGFLSKADQLFIRILKEQFPTAEA